MKNRVWVYMSDKELNKAQLSELNEATAAFLSGWNAHGQALTASFELLHKRFLIIKADEASFTASGCSIDKQVQFVKKMESVLGISFFNRLLVAIKKEDGVEVVHSSKISDLLKAGAITEESLVYNNAVSTDQELLENFLVPLKQSWLSRFIPVKA